AGRGLRARPGAISFYGGVSVTRRRSPLVNKSMLSLLVAATALIATPALTQQEPIKRIPLQTVEFPANFTTNIMIIEVAPNAVVARHTHPGMEAGYVLEGELELMIDGKGTL